MIPADAMRLRLIYLPEQPARREVMIIYVEPSGASAGMPAVDEFLRRALLGIRLEPQEVDVAPRSCWRGDDWLDCDLPSACRRCSITGCIPTLPQENAYWLGLRRGGSYGLA